MVRRSKPKMFRHNGRQPLDAQVLRYIVMNESGRCAPEKLLYTFQEFRNEAQVLEWIENLGTAVKRQLMEFKANEVRACLNGIQVCKKYGFQRQMQWRMYQNPHMLLSPEKILYE